MVEIIEIYDTLPQNIKDIVDSFNEEVDSYGECSRIIRELNSVGWTADYDLSGTLFDLKRLTNKDEIEEIVDDGVNEIFNTVCDKYKLEYGDISPDEAMALNKIKQELSVLVHKFVKNNF